jgi:hypothetical protein
VALAAQCADAEVAAGREAEETAVAARARRAAYEPAGRSADSASQRPGVSGVGPGVTTRAAKRQCVGAAAAPTSGTGASQGCTSV